MIFEVAVFDITAGQEAEFEAGVASAVPLFRAAAGCSSFRLERSIEHPSSYRLVAGWETVEHHMVTFRQSEAFAQWRSIVGSFFASPPQVQHTATVVDGF